MSRAVVVLAVVLTAAAITWASWTSPQADDVANDAGAQSGSAPPTEVRVLEGNAIECPVAEPPLWDLYAGEVDANSDPIDVSERLYFRVVGPEGQPIPEAWGSMGRKTGPRRGVTTTFYARNGWSWPVGQRSYPEGACAQAWVVPTKLAEGQGPVCGVRIVGAEFEGGVCVLRLPGARWLRGTLRTADGEPAGLMVHADVVRDGDTRGESIPEIQGRPSSAEDGSFRLWVPEREALDVSVWSELGEVFSQRVAVDAQDIELTLPGSSRLELRVVGPNGERPDGQVRFTAHAGVKYKERTLTIACVDGLAVAWGIQPDLEIDVLVEAAPLAPWHRVGVRTADRVVDIDLVEGESIGGTLIDRHGEPVALSSPDMFRVAAVSLDDPDRYVPVVEPKADGGWRFAALVPGRYRMELHHRYYGDRVLASTDGVVTNSPDVQLRYIRARR